MKTPERNPSEEQESSFPIQFKILFAIITGGVVFLLLQAMGIF